MGSKPQALALAQTRQEFGNTEVAVVKIGPGSSEVTVGHMPREISRTSWYFLQNDGEITCEKIVGSRHCSPLIQGGMEIPRKYNLLELRKLLPVTMLTS